MPNSYNRKRRPRYQKYDHEELGKRLRLSLVGIFVFIATVILLLNFFGPQIGAIFGFISINRNQEGPSANITLNPPSFSDLPKATNEEFINIEGYSPPGSNVKLFLNGPEKGDVLTSGDGMFIFEDVLLIEGRNTVFAKAYDDKGNGSDKSETHIITVDNDKPDIDIDAPKDGDTVRNLNERVMIRGKVSEKTQITINDRLVVQKPDLSFEFLLGVSEGNVNIKVEATDEAGNVKVLVIQIEYKRESG